MLPELRADPVDAVQLNREFKPWIAPLRAVASAETELELAPKVQPRPRREVEQSTDAASGDAPSEVATVPETGLAEPSSPATARSEPLPKALSERSPYE
jgi:hypothetical protein